MIDEKGRLFGKINIVDLLVILVIVIAAAVLAVLLSRWLMFHGFTIFLSAASTTALYDAIAKYWAGLFCLLGHMFPVMFKFKGGKGILSGGTIAIMIDWRVALVVWGGFLLLAVLTRYVSLGSCWAGLSFPFVTWFVYQDELIAVLAVIIGGLILFKHRGNMVRIVQGTESKFALHKKKEAEAEPEAPDPSEEIEETVEEQEESEASADQEPAEEEHADQVEEENSEQEEESSTQEEASEEVSDDQEDKKLQEGEA